MSLILLGTVSFFSSKMATSLLGQFGFGQTTVLGMKMNDWMSAASLETIRAQYFKTPILKDSIQDYYKNGMPVFAVNPTKATNDSTKMDPTVSVYPMQILNRCFSVVPTLKSSFTGVSSPTRELVDDIIDYTDGTDTKHVFNDLSSFTKYILPMGILSEMVNPQVTGMRSLGMGVAMYGPLRAVPNIWGSAARPNVVVGFIIRKVKQTPILDLLSETENIPMEANRTIDDTYMMQPYVFDDIHQSVFG